MQHDKLTIFFSGMIAADPHQGGATWAVLQYLLGLKRLGHEVWFVEPIAREKLRPAGAGGAAKGGLEDSVNARYFRNVTEAFGLAETSALLVAGSSETAGTPYERLRGAAKRASVLFNISGMLTDEALLEFIPTRVYLDLDPAFIQLWNAVSGIDMRFDRHTHFVTVGLAIGTPGCDVPTCSRSWIPTFQPIVLQHWPAGGVGEKIETDAFTTVANWRGYGSITHEGKFYGQKAHSLRQLIDLPAKVAKHGRGEQGRAVMPALNIHPAEVNDLALLAEHGWKYLDAADVAGTPEKYARFIRGSRGELGIAKSGYVVSRCGWFSDRSACYLASGRPVVAQETGFSAFLPCGEGLLAFSTSDEAAAGIEAVCSDPARHARAARTLAVELFDSDKVLGRLLERVVPEAKGANPFVGTARRVPVTRGSVRAKGSDPFPPAAPSKAHPSHVTTRALRNVLGKACEGPGGAGMAQGGQKILSIHRRFSDYSTSFALEELSVEFPGNRRVDLMFKNLSTDALLHGARQTRPAMIYDPRREILVYQHILASAGLGTARCHAAVGDVRR